MEEPAWRALSPIAQALYPWLKLEWRGPKANNNGKIQLSVRQAAERLGVATNTAAKAFHELQAKGFVVVTHQAHLGVKGQATAPEFELTEIQLPHASQPVGRKLYRQWREGADLPVQKAAVHNPTGARKNKTLSQKA
jgi:DNA-binding transcriptional regulator YhcF (GntR family)